MKKKVWDITVKDNPNRVVMGENDEFYTTDTEAYLVFNLDDKNFSPESAVLTLENRNDGSLKNETVDVVDGLIEWEMPQRYIEHFGNWQGQLVYEDTKDGQPELYTSATFSFVVNAHIGDKKKPSLVEIENWRKFIRDGTELIETWEDMEDLRQANEAQRQANYQELLDTGVLQTNINTKLEQLEEEYAPKLTEVTAQLAQKANITYIEDKIAQVASGTPKIIADNPVELNSNYPSGSDENALVISSGEIYYWNNDEWLSTGVVYQSTGINEKTIDSNKLKYSWGYLLTENKITVNFQTSKITVQPVWVSRDQFFTNIPKQTLDISGATGIQYCYFKNTTKELTTLNSDLGSNSMVLFSFYQGEIQGPNANKIRVIDEDGKTVPVNNLIIEDHSITTSKLVEKWGHILATDKDVKPVSINFETQEIRFYTGWVDIEGMGLRALHTQSTMDISNLSGATYFYYNPQTSKVESSNLWGMPKNAIRLFIIYNGDVYGQNVSSIRVIDENGLDISKEIIDLLKRESVTFDDQLDRIIISPNLYLVEGEPLPIYKDSILVTDNYYEDMKISIINVDNNRGMTVEYLYEDYELKSESLEKNFKIALSSKKNPDYNYTMDVTNNVKAKSYLEGKNIKYLPIGDSLTQNDIGVWTKERLIDFGATVQLTGTKVDSDCLNTEGRGGWTSANFTGRSSRLTGSYIGLPSDGGLTTNLQNPFLKLATEEDKIDFPEYCYRRSGSPGKSIEKSYAEEEDKSGEFYIFDFQYYLDTFGLEIPNVITIALGTNQHPEGLEGHLFALELMINQIKKVTPNVKIGIIPPPPHGNSADGNFTFKHMIMPYTEAIMNKVEDWKLIHTELYVVPIWQHFNREFTFNYASKESLSDINSIRKNTKLERIHPNVYGKTQYVNALAAFITNVV